MPYDLDDQETTLKLQDCLTAVEQIIANGERVPESYLDRIADLEGRLSPAASDVLEISRLRYGQILQHAA